MRAGPAAALLALALAGSAAPRPPAPSRAPPRGPHLEIWEPAGALGAVVAGFGDLWADDRGRGRLVRLDARGAVRAAIAVDGRLGLSAGRHDLWALEGANCPIGELDGPLLRVDPRTNRVRARIPLTRAGRPLVAFGVQAAGRGAWVWGPHALLRVEGDRIAARVGVGDDARGELTGFVTDGRRLVAATADGHLLRFDARTRRRRPALRLPLRRPSLKALRGHVLIVAAAGVVAAADVETGRLLWRRRLGFRAGATLTSGGLVWAYSSALHEPGDRVTALRLRTGDVVTSGVLPAFGSTGLAVHDGRVALATAGGHLLVLTPFPA